LLDQVNEVGKFVVKSEGVLMRKAVLHW